MALVNTQVNLVLSSDAGQRRIRITDGDMHHVLAISWTGERRVFLHLPRYTLKDLNLLGLQQTLKKRDLPYLCTYQ